MHGLFHSSLKPSGLCCQYLTVLQLHGMLGVINVDVFGNLRGCRARSPMFAKPCLQGSFCLANVHCIAFFTFDLIYWPTTFSLLTGSFGFTNNCRSVFVGLKYVGMPYFPKTRLICSENPFTYGIMTGIFFDFSFIDVSNVSPDVSTSF